MTSPSPKTLLRQKILARLKQAAMEDPQGCRSARLRALIGQHLQGALPMVVAVYAPLPHEVNLLPLLTEYPQHRYVFPRCGRGGRMDFHEVRNPQTDLEPGAMGIPAPKADCTGVEAQEIDLLLVPGVAFTAAGDRLGYGGGFYDRYMPRCTKARICAYAFEEQRVDALPTEAHDLRIPHIIFA